MQTSYPQYRQREAPGGLRDRCLLLGLMLLLLAAGCRPADHSLIIAPVDPLQKVLREAAFFSPTDLVADVARGEHASYQIAVRASVPITGLAAHATRATMADAELPAPTLGMVGYVKVGRATPVPSRDRLLPPSGYYPDPILEMSATDVGASQTQPVWMTVPIPVEAPPGQYSGEVTLSGLVGGKRFRERHTYSVRVHAPVVDSTRLRVTNWYTLSPDRLGMLNDGVPVEPYTDRYWDLVRVIARKMAEYRQNVALISPLRLAQYTQGEDRLEIDFAHFDRTVRIFQEEGVIGLIEGSHIGRRESTWTTPFVVHVPVLENGETSFERLPIRDARASAFYARFLSVLVEHLRERGWLDRYMQHLADEPIEANADSYVEIADFVRRHAPELRIIEAVHNRDLVGSIDVWVPQLDFLDQDFDFYAARMQQGEEAWFYTCLAPQGEYANRFVELPLIKTRILHWINYRYNIPGYLHWGYNSWRHNPFEETTGIITESGNVLPGGDAWIVYPASGRILSSLRLEAMRDGIVDYELLRKLEARYPEEASELARRVVYRFDRYDTSIEAFRAKRRRVLELLSTVP